MNEELKTIGEVFRDYNKENQIKKARIININMYKRTSKLEVNLKCDKLLLVEEILDFEDYLQNRFSIENAELIIDYSEIKNEEQNDTTDNIKQNWNEVLKYLSKRYPMAKAIMKGSNIVKSESNILTIELSTKGADFLYARGYDRIVSDIIKNLYNKSYKIKITENISEEAMVQYQENLRMMEKIAIEKHAVAYVEDKPEQKKTVSKEQKKEEKIKKENVQTPVEEVEEEYSPLIIGAKRALNNLKDTVIKVSDITPDIGRIALEGEVIRTDARVLKSEKWLIMFDLFDGTSTITCKCFVEPEKAEKTFARIKKAKGLKVVGNAQFDPYAKELGVIANIVIETEGRKKLIRMDTADEKRVELHMHTQMSQMDAVTPAEELIKRAIKWGMKSIAITDHGVVQAFPEAHKLLLKNKSDIKIIYGVEAYLVPDKMPSVSNDKGQDIDTEYCVFDLETTGISPKTEKITEIGAIKVKNGEIIDTFECFVNPEKPIPDRVVEITNITDDMVKDAETIDSVLPKFLEFIGDSVLVAHNAEFDIGFIKHNAKILNLKFDNTYIDTLKLAKDLFPDYKKYKLGIIADKLGIKVDVAHRALDDVKTLVQVFNVMIKQLKEKNVTTLKDIDEVFNENNNTEAYKKLESYHAIILAKDYVGLKNLYKLVSYSHLNYFYKKPRILKSLYKKYSEGLILGSACEAGELYRAILNGKSDEEIERIASDYDYLEIQPVRK